MPGVVLDRIYIRARRVLLDALDALASTLAGLVENPLAGAVTQTSLVQLHTLFGTEDATGTQMAVEATRGVDHPADIAASCAALASDLLEALSV